MRKLVLASLPLLHVSPCFSQLLWTLYSCDQTAYEAKIAFFGDDWLGLKRELWERTWKGDRGSDWTGFTGLGIRIIDFTGQTLPPPFLSLPNPPIEPVIQLNI
jgi:hypothetical protein